jgi:ABC-2 type transport system ATP-binding protein
MPCTAPPGAARVALSAVAPAIYTHDLRKVYPAPGNRPRFGPARAAPPGAVGHGGTSARGGGAGQGIVALVGLDLEVREGEFFGLLGPNGAGKTTTIGILTTRVRPTGGTACVAGADVSREPVEVRQRIGVVPQRPNPDRSLNAIENLIFHAGYFGIPRGTATAHARSLLDTLGIADKAEAKVDELSGGQQQRLMIARALIHQPLVIFLDEPTVGLDPQARLALWDILRDLHGQGRTIIMTTHYMEEADRLCQRLAIIDGGKLLAVDTPEGLKARAPGGTLVELVLDGNAESVLDRARSLPNVSGVEARNGVLRAYSDHGGQVIPALIDAAQSSGRVVKNIYLAPPSLETLFIALTGRKLE